MKLHGIIAIFAVGTVFALSASAGIVTNGDFETGDLSGWTMTQYDGWDISVCDGCGVGGSFGANSGAVGGEPTIEQTLTTVFGASYQISMWESQSGGAGVDFDFFWNGVSVGGDHTQTAHGFDQFTANVIGTGSDILKIGMRNDPGGSNVDNITVDATGTPTPEPATGAMLSLALLGLLPLANKLRRKA